MRRQRDSVTAVGPGKWRIAVSAGRGPDGKRLRKARIVRGSKRQAEVELDRLRAELMEAPRSDMTLASFWDSMFMPWSEQRVRVRTADSYKSKFDQHLRDALGDKPIAKLDAYTLDRYFAGLSGNRSGPAIYATLRMALRRAVKWSVISSNPLDAVDAPTVEPYHPDVLTVEESAEYVRAFRGTAVEPYALMALATGARRSEIAALEWSDLDLEAGTVRLEKGRHQRGAEVWDEPSKTPKSRRTIFISVWAIPRLKKLRGIGPLATENGAAMKPDKISDEWARVIEAAGLRRLPIRNARHTYATQLVQVADIRTAQDQLGHTVVTTTQRYANPGAEVAKKAAAAMPDLGATGAK